MKWFVSAGSPAGVFVCAPLSVTSAARAQESPPASAAPETSQPVSEPQAAPGEGTALPSVVVTAPAETKKGKKKKVEASKGGLTTLENGRLGCAFHNRLRNTRPDDWDPPDEPAAIPRPPPSAEAG